MGTAIFSALAYLFICCINSYSHGMTDREIVKLREDVREMFYHAYNGYMKYAYPYDELRPLSCDGHDTWGSYSLTLIDALDTLAVMGNQTEFQRVVSLILERANFDVNINVSVFETNIRIIGGSSVAISCPGDISETIYGYPVHILTDHLPLCDLFRGRNLTRRLARWSVIIQNFNPTFEMGINVEEGWPCAGPLLRVARDVANRLLPAFDTPTGMPYGTVNLREGVPEGETPITCTAGVGTYIIEFGTLSRLTGDPVYEQVALRALHAIWQHRSPLNLLGNHIDVLTGRWTAQDSGIGAGVDSYFEYLAKGASLLRRPELLSIFQEAREAVEKHLRHDDWHLWATMTKGYVTMAVFQSLEAYWPGVLTIVGDINSAQRIVYNYHQVWKQFGFTPEFYNIPQSEAPTGREGYPLRPELVESLMYLYQATQDPSLLAMGADILATIKHSARTQCGYATIKSVTDHTLENRMESFFLAETTKYLYLLFDRDHWLHETGQVGTAVNVGSRQCVVEAGGYIFNSEAHPVDPGALACCSTKDEDWFLSLEDQVALILDPTRVPWNNRKGHKKKSGDKTTTDTGESDCDKNEIQETRTKEEEKPNLDEQKVEGKIVILKGQGNIFTFSETPNQKPVGSEMKASDEKNEGERRNSDQYGREEKDDNDNASIGSLIENSVKDAVILNEKEREETESDIGISENRIKEKVSKEGSSKGKDANEIAELDVLNKIREKVKDRILDKGRNDGQGGLVTGKEGDEVGSGIIKQQDSPRFASLSEVAERGQGGGNNSGMENSGSSPSVSSSKYGTASTTPENRTPTTSKIVPALPTVKRVFSLPELRQRVASDLLGYRNLTTTTSHALLSCTHPPFTHMLNLKGQMFNP